MHTLANGTVSPSNYVVPYPPTQADAHVKAYHAVRNPYVLMEYSPQLKGRARDYGRGYRAFRVIETTDGLRPASVNSKTVVRVIRDTGSIAYGSTEKSMGVVAHRQLVALTAHMNRLHHHKMGWNIIKIAEIDAQSNVEYQREMIEAIGGLERYAKRAKFVAIHSDETGTLMERRTAAQPIRAVAVTCPSTGRKYLLRVPPAMERAKQAVAWTFNVPELEYYPTAQT